MFFGPVVAIFSREVVISALSLMTFRPYSITDDKTQLFYPLFAFDQPAPVINKVHRLLFVSLTPMLKVFETLLTIVLNYPEFDLTSGIQSRA